MLLPIEPLNDFPYKITLSVDRHNHTTLNIDRRNNAHSLSKDRSKIEARQ